MKTKLGTYQNQQSEISSDLSLKQLREILPSTNGVKKPSRDWINQNKNSDQVFSSQKFNDESELIVFNNGFYYYSDGQHGTVLRIDSFSELLFEINENGMYNSLKYEEFCDSSYTKALCFRGLWQLNKNAEKRIGSHKNIPLDENIISSYSIPDFADTYIEEEERKEKSVIISMAIQELTPKQREVAYILMDDYKTTNEQLAKRLHISSDSVRDRREGIYKSLLKYIEKNGYKHLFKGLF